MKKSLTKITKTVIAFAMTIGMGVSAAVTSNRKVAPMDATAGATPSGTWAPITSTSDINTEDDFLLAYEGSENRYYATGTTSGNALIVDTSLTNAKTIQFVEADGGYYIKVSNSNYLKNSSNNLTSSTPTSIWAINSTDFCIENITNSNYFLAGISDGDNIKAYANNSSNKSSRPNVHVYKRIPSTQTLSSDPISGEAYIDQTITVSSNASSSVTWSIVDDGDTTASGAAVTSAGIVSVTGAGTVKVKAAADDYNDATIVLTFSERPLVPFITPSKNSTSGYTGMNEELSFDYGNLTSILTIVSGNSSIVTVEEPSASAGSGTVQINFVGAGSTTVLFKDGATQLASVSVTVTASYVSITGLPTDDYVNIGEDLDLASTITIDAFGTCSDDVTWSSDNPSIATVSDFGVVRGVSVGTVNISVVSVDYPSATMTCEVTVCEAIVLSDGSYSLAAPAEIESEPRTTLINGYTLNILNAHNNASSANELTLVSGTLSTSNTLISNKTPVLGPITKIIFNIKSGSAGTAVYKAAISDSEIINPVTATTYTRTGPGQIVITADSAANLRYFAFSSTKTSVNGHLESICICYENPTPEEAINEISTRSTLTYRYTTDPSLTITLGAIRFGGLVSKALWDKLDEVSEIQGYGILLSTASYLGANQLKTYIESYDGVNVKNFYHEVASAMPDLANTTQTKGLLEDYYVWNLYKTVTDSLAVPYTSVAYIRTESGVVFFNQVTASASSLAEDLLATDEYDDDSLDGSLKYLADLA